jgi:uncharacterized protein YndB with AHSA1/START domain
VTLTDTTAPGQRDALSFAFELPHPPEKVWRALTDPALLTAWLLPVVGFSLEPGAAFRFQTEPHPDWDGTVQCQVVEIDAYRKLSYTWSVPGLETVVTFTLTPTASGTHLVLVQSGFAGNQKQAFGGARYGWRLMGGRLVEMMRRMR